MADQCLEVVAADQRTRKLRATATHLVWIHDRSFDERDGERADGAIRALEFDSGEVVTLVTGLRSTGELVVHGDEVYWISWGSPSTIMAVPLAGGEPRVVVPDRGPINGLVVDDEHVYFEDDDDGSTWRAPAHESGPEVLFMTRAERAALPLSRGEFIDSLHLHGDYLYWLEAASVGRSRLDGSGHESLQESIYVASELVVQGDHFAWGVSDGDFVALELLGDEPGHSLTVAHQDDGQNFSSLALDDDQAYWAYTNDDNTIGTLMRTDVVRMESEVLLRGRELSFTLIALHGEDLYLATMGDSRSVGPIVRMPRARL